MHESEHAADAAAAVYKSHANEWDSSSNNNNNVIYTTEHHNLCLEVQVIIAVVPDYNNENLKGAKGVEGGVMILGFAWQELAFGVTGITITLLFIFGCCSWCGKLLPQCFIRSNKDVTPDDGTEV